MKHLGDITKIDGSKIEPVNCITFGSPCQDLSVAGKRKGLEGERSGLFMEAVRIIKEMRDGKTNGDGRADRAVGCVRLPRYAVWENVPGAFSSNKGEDFRIVLEELARIAEPEFTIPRCKKWKHSGIILGNAFSITWRLFDAQYWGVPQRRKRLCVLCDFDGFTAPPYCLLNASDHPLIPIETHLKWVIEENASPKYHLSQKAAQGILNRASRRGKELPEILRTALMSVANQSSACF